MYLRGFHRLGRKAMDAPELNDDLYHSPNIIHLRQTILQISSSFDIRIHCMRRKVHGIGIYKSHSRA